MTIQEHFDPRLPGRDTSLWLHTTPETGYQPLAEGREVEVAILGGGLTGLLTAYFLAREGVSVAVLEAGRIASDTTGHTTAKITSGHGAIYKGLAGSFGQDGARLYAEANEAALARYAALVEEHSFDCDFQRMPAYIYVESGKGAGLIREEMETAATLGLPVSYQEEIPLPYRTAAAIKYDNQARFHPRKFLLALADWLKERGVFIHEETRAREVKHGQTVEVDTDRGVIKAERVLVATHYPFYDPSFFFARLFPMRSVVLGCKVGGQPPMGMFFSMDEEHHSLRPHPYEGGEILLVSGYGHRTGHGGDTLELYRKLEGWARNRFVVDSIEYHWSAQDNRTPDMVPYIGPISKDRPNVYVATGYGGWGMTQSMIAAMLVSDLALGRDHPWKEFYNPQRLSAKAVFSALAENMPVAKSLIGGFLSPAEHFKPQDLAPGEGGIVEEKGEKKGVGRDLEGALHVVDPHCRHMGCQLVWNKAERTWDCPCHGSRYDASGKVIHGPANADLHLKTLADAPPEA